MNPKGCCYCSLIPPMLFHRLISLPISFWPSLARVNTSLTLAINTKDFSIRATGNTCQIPTQAFLLLIESAWWMHEVRPFQPVAHSMLIILLCSESFCLIKNSALEGNYNSNTSEFSQMNREQIYVNRRYSSLENLV